MSKKAVILLSGGIDSATCAAVAKSEGYECIALSFDYGQRSQSEWDAAVRVCSALDIRTHRIFKLDLGQFGGSALVDRSIDMPTVLTDDIPLTYVPARNTIFLSIALGLAEILQAQDIFIGVNAIDYSNYSDCRPEFIEQYERVANLGTKAGVEGRPFRIHAPLQYKSKADIILWGQSLGLDYGITVSCYDADEQGRACRQCPSCLLRATGFKEANVPDPTHYQN